MVGASSTGMFKILKPSMIPQPTDIKAAVGWGVAAATAGLYLVQPWGWIKKTFIEKQEEQN